MRNETHPMAFSPDSDRALITHDFPLRPDLIVRLSLPVGFNTDDLARLTGYLQSLAFDPATNEEPPSPETRAS